MNIKELKRKHLNLLKTLENICKNLKCEDALLVWSPKFCSKTYIKQITCRIGDNMNVMC